MLALGDSRRNSREFGAYFSALDFEFGKLFLVFEYTVLFGSNFSRKFLKTVFRVENFLTETLYFVSEIIDFFAVNLGVTRLTLELLRFFEKLVVNLFYVFVRVGDFFLMSVITLYRVVEFRAS